MVTRVMAAVHLRHEMMMVVVVGTLSSPTSSHCVPVAAETAPVAACHRSITAAGGSKAGYGDKDDGSRPSAARDDDGGGGGHVE